MILYLDSNQGEAGTDALIADAEAGITLNDVNSKMYIVNQQGMNVKTIGLYNSWNSTKDELGELKESVDVNNINVKVSDETSELCTISVKLKFEKRECTFEFVINTDYTLESGAINPSYTTGEKMGKAGMNTLIGMGTVFVVLIFISFIISLFKYISVYENRKKEQKEDTTSVGVDNAIAQIVSNEEENVEDDLELIAVITAAIAASEGTSTDGLVVRSIRKVNNRRK
ncbi:MAG: OadG family protein [Lachnospira sp.]|nr:OadG family protein [Lachnospira sp.]